MSRYLSTALLLFLMVVALPALAGEIHEAIRSGEVDRVEKLLTADSDLVHQRDITPMQDTPLGLVAIDGNVDIARLLIEHGADVNLGDIDNSTPLDNACVRNKLAMATYLIEQGANVNNRDRKGDCALSFAMSANALEIIDLLLARGADLYYRSPDGRSLLHTASATGNVAMVQRMLDLGENADFVSAGGMTPMIFAAGGGHTEVMELLLANGGTLGSQDPDYRGWTPIRYALDRNSVGSVRWLVGKGYPISGVNEDGQGAMMRIRHRGNAEMANLLIELGIDIDLQDKYGETALIKAIGRDNVELTTALLAADARLDIGNNRQGHPPLHLAAMKGNISLLEQLLQGNIDINGVNGNGETALELAARYGQMEMTRLLVAAGASGQSGTNDRCALSGQEKVGKKEAVIWHLGHSGWAVKTRKHLLIFDYFGEMNPPSSSPGLANGFINPTEIKDEKVTVISTHSHRDHFSLGLFDWADEIDDITFIMGNEVPGRDDYTLLTPREDYKINGLKIKAINSTDLGIGLVVEVDGLVIFHGGDHSNGHSAGCTDGLLPAYTAEIDYLASRKVHPDIAFLGIRGCSLGDPDEVKLGVQYANRILSPKVFFPQHSGDNYWAYSQFIQDIGDEFPQVQMAAPGNRGDHFRFSDGKLRQLNSPTKDQAHAGGIGKAGCTTSTSPGCIGR
jgi:ankyrin repeat protein/L-ascorbate metabolism protein UlaG (beta-lactamase superfamily)